MKSVFEMREKDGVSVIVCLPLESLGFVNAFSTRLGGVSPLPSEALNLGHFAGDTRDNVQENRRRFLRAIDAEAYRLKTVRQVHSRIAHRVDGGEYGEGDALYADLPDCLLGVFTADCQPVLLVDARTRAFAAVHAGWRGTLARLTEHTLSCMQDEFGTRPEDCYAALGPVATVECYEVGDEVVADFRSEFSYAETLFDRPSGSIKTHLNVREANRRQLIESGVPDEQVFVSGFCTMRQTALFFSHRRESGSGPVGRLLSVVGKKC